MMLHNITKIITDFKDELSTVFGALIQFLIVGKNKPNKLRFIIFLILSTIFTMFYVTEPIIVYFNITEPYIKVLYAFNGLFGLELLSILVVIFPKVARNKILFILGVKYDDN